MEDENVNYPTTFSWTTDSLIPNGVEINDDVSDEDDVEDLVLTEDHNESFIEEGGDASTELVDDTHDGDIEEDCDVVDVDGLVLAEEHAESSVEVEDTENTELVDVLQDNNEEIDCDDVDVKILDLSPVLPIPTQSDSDHVEHSTNIDLPDASVDTSTNQDTNSTAFKLYHYLDNMSMNGACSS